MKDRVNQCLLGGFILSLALCVWVWFYDIRLILFLPSISFFFIQILLFRVTCSRFYRSFPIVLDLLMAAVGALLCLLGRSWDALLGLILLCASISPAVGCVLGWLVWTIRAKKST